MDEAGARDDRLVGDLRRPAAAARRLAVPHRDQDIAVGDRGAAGHDIIADLALPVAGQFEDHRRLGDQSIEGDARFVMFERRPVTRAGERKDRLNLPAERQRRLRRGLVGAVGERGDQTEQWRLVREKIGRVRQDLAPCPLDQPEIVGQSLGQCIARARTKAVRAMAGDPDIKDERRERGGAERIQGPFFFFTLSVAYLPAAG